LLVLKRGRAIAHLSRKLGTGDGKGSIACGRINNTPAKGHQEAGNRVTVAKG